MSDANSEPEKKAETNANSSPAKPEPPPPPIETQHELTLNGQKLAYTVRAGMLPVQNEKGEHKANIFFTAYTLNTTQSPRPLTFVFNGGPGSASVWLHLGAVGPYRVKMEDEGWMPAPPYQLVENPHTWLGVSDLVFVDPVGTGYSRALDEEDNKNYWSVEGDLKSLGEFIRLYLTRYQRWASPLFIAGESYGTTRAAGLADHLFSLGIGLKGILLISTVLNFQTISFGRGNDLPYSIYVPTYAATAWYHGCLSQELQQKPLTELLAEAEAWAFGEYTLALMKGDHLPAKEQTKIAKKLAQYTGLSVEYILQSKLRIHISRFCKKLLEGKNRSVGRLDSRFQGYEEAEITEFPEFDPSLTAITPPYTAMINHYVRQQLGYETDVPYEVLSMTVNSKWEWPKGEFPDTSDALRKAMQANPHMKVWVGQGYYDLATPHLGALYHFSHMGLGPELHQNIEYHFYEAGHMFYLDVTSLAKLRQNIEAFYQIKA